MSDRAAKFAFVEPDTGPARAGDHFPRVLVMWSVLAFCLSVWSIVVLAVRHFI